MTKQTTVFMTFLLLTLLGLIALLPLYGGAAHTMTLTQGADTVLRLHVKARSDSAEDQRVKLQVRDALLPFFENADTYADARTFLTKNGAALQAAAEQALRDAGVEYGATLALGRSMFPDRVYDGILFPAGEYDALTVTLGGGDGQNWWCVLFPPLCIVTEDGGTVDLSRVEYRSALYDWLCAHVEGFPW